MQRRMTVQSQSSAIIAVILHRNLMQIRLRNSCLCSRFEQSVDLERLVAPGGFGV
jgi:hypothetical protein